MSDVAAQGMPGPAGFAGFRLIRMRRLPKLADRSREGDGDFRWLAETGEIEIPEVGVRLGAGKLFGEIALFAADGRRAAAARARGPTRVAELTGRGRPAASRS